MRSASMARRVLGIYGLSTIAVAWPVLDLFGRNPEVFVANRASSWQMTGFALVVTLFVPTLLSLLVWSLEQLSPGAGEFAYGAVLALLGVVTGLVVARQVTSDRMVTVLVVVVVLALVWAVEWWGGSFLPATAVAVPVVLAFFLVASPAAGLIWSGAEIDENATIRNPVPIVFIQLDEFPLSSIVTPEGEINEALFPSFARLARQGTWYRNALSNSIATTQSVPSILTGKLFERGLSPTWEDHPRNLFTLLADDYDMHVIEWVASMCPAEVCPDYAGRAPAHFGALLADAAVVFGHLAAPPGLEGRLPSIDNTWAGFLGQAEAAEGAPIEITGLPVPDPERRADWVDWLQRIANGIDVGTRPVLSYAHVQAPHVPWVTNPSGTHYVRPEQYTEVEGVGGDGRWVGDQALGVIGFQRHLYQLGLLDRMLGRIFDRLDRTRTWDRTLVVVVGDHGTTFELGEHRRWPYDGNIDDLYRIPLFVKYPGQREGRVVDDPAYGIDILPTIVDVLDAHVDWVFDGISLLDVPGTDRPHEVIWWCCSRDAASTDLAALFAQVERNHAWLPDQTSWLGVAGAGDLARHMGARVEDLGAGETLDVAWELDLGRELLEETRPAGMAQTYLNGRVAHVGDLSERSVLFALDGVVAGSGVILPEGPGTGTVQGIVAEQMIRPGANRVDLLVRSGGSWVVARHAELKRELRRPDGSVIELEAEGGRRIQVDRAVRGADGTVVLTGWAADVALKVTPDTIYVFAGDLLLVHGPPNLDNRNVVAWFGSDDLLRSGFEFRVEDLPEGVAQITVVAGFGDHAVAETVPITPAG
jgi:hypothetical protein